MGGVDESPRQPVHPGCGHGAAHGSDTCEEASALGSDASLSNLEPLLPDCRDSRKKAPRRELEKVLLHADEFALGIEAQAHCDARELGLLGMSQRTWQQFLNGAGG